MAGLLERPTTQAPEAPAPPPAAAAPVDRLCPSCASPLAAGQDWCLECGTAQPGRLGGRPGWRSALAILALTGVLASGAVAAAYAAMSSDARREAAAAPPPAVAPVVTPPPPAPPAPQPELPAPKVEAPPKADPPADPAPVADTPAPAADEPTVADSGTGAQQTEPEAVVIALESDAASTYDPFGRADASVTNADRAIDGKDNTAWRVPAAADGTVRMGLVVSLDEARRIGSLRFSANTPGFTVETYATSARKIPANVTDDGWKHLDGKSDVGVEETLPIDGTFRHVLLWVTVQPADTRVVIPELELLE